MATVITQVDDLDHERGKATPAEITELRLALGDEAVTLDLSAAHADELAAMLRPYLKAGRKLPAVKSSSEGKRVMRPRRPAEEYAALRSWADGNGLSYTDKHGKNDYKRIWPKWDAHKRETGLSFA